MIDQTTRKLIHAENGIRYVKILKTTRDSHGYPNYLLSGKDHSGVEWRGWLREGESARDIKWDSEKVGGWAQALKD